MDGTRSCQCKPKTMLDELVSETIERLQWVDEVLSLDYYLLYDALEELARSKTPERDPELFLLIERWDEFFAVEIQLRHASETVWNRKRRA